MFQITFIPKPQHSARIRLLPKEKMERLHSVLQQIVYEVFSARARGYRSGFSPIGVVTVTAVGVSPFSDRSLQEIVQNISNGLSRSGISELYVISQVTRNVEPLDILVAPEVTSLTNCPEALMGAFDLMERDIPAQFVCPITNRIMHNPAYLTTNPKINYEYTALMTWVVEKNNDPLTRSPISTVGIINNNDLQKRIYSFVMDMVLGKRVEYYFETERKEMEVQCSLSSNVTSLFGGAVKSAGAASSMARLFQTLKLDDELYSLAAKALRRAVHENNAPAVEALFSEYEKNKIIDLQDSNPQSRKTALHIAINRDNPEMTSLLLSHGAKTDIADASGETAEDMVRNSNHAEIKRLFLVVTAAAARR